MKIVDYCNRLVAKLNLPVARDVRHNNTSDEAIVRRRQIMHAKLVRFLHENDYHREFNGHELMQLVNFSNFHRDGEIFGEEHDPFMMENSILKHTDPREAHRWSLHFLTMWFAGPVGLGYESGRVGVREITDQHLDMLERSEGQRRHGA